MKRLGGIRWCIWKWNLLNFYFDNNNFNSTINGRLASLTMFSTNFSFLVFWNLFEFSCVWHVPLAQMWTYYQIGKFNMWTLFCNVCIDFLNNRIWKEIMLELKGKPSSETTFSTGFSFQNLIFWNLFEFSAA
jgi:hypothetical protein